MICASCNESFPCRVIIAGKQKNLCHRKLCLKCNPFKSGVRYGSKNREAVASQCNSCGKKFDFVYGNGYTKNKCSSCSTKARRERRRLEAIEYKGGKCCRCGYNRCLSALDFHHRDQLQKAFTINGNYTRGWEVLKKELDKCDLTCSNCHREFHAGV
jgi:hypothetical protein